MLTAGAEPGTGAGPLLASRAVAPLVGFDSGRGPHVVATAAVGQVPIVTGVWDFLAGDAGPQGLGSAQQLGRGHRRAWLSIHAT